ncbi:MAG: hypothetical protein AAF849_14480 [Bacteroidota bacterium]
MPCTTTTTDADGNPLGQPTEVTITIEGDCSEGESTVTNAGLTATTTCR